MRPLAFLARTQSPTPAATPTPTPAPDPLRTAIAEWNMLLDRQPLSEPITTRTDVHLSPANRLTNTHWGDELLEKDPTTFRIYCQNVNGLRLDQRGGEFATICQIAQEVQADLMSITEHNLDTTKFAVRKVCHDARTHALPHSSLTMSSSPIEMVHNYKPGGTFTMSCGKISARLLRSGTDSMGRWSYQTFSGKRNCNITIVTAYQVCEKRTNQRGCYTAAAQQESLLRQRGESNPNPRKHFRLDLTKFLTQRRQEGDELILVGDFNEALGDEPEGISKMCSQLELVDLMHSLHDSRNLATYARGRKRLDYALATPRAALTILCGGYEPFNHRLASDHRAFYLDFNEAALFGSQSPTIPPLHKRDIHARNPKEVTKYLEAKYDLMKAHNIFARIRRLQDDPILNPDSAESIDKDIYRISIAAGKKCQKFRDPAWSTELHEARARVGILKRVLSMRRTRYDQQTQIAHLQTLQGTSTFLLPSTVEECQQQLRQAQATVSKIAQQSTQHRDTELLAKIDTFDLEGDKSKANILRNIRKAEEMRRLFAKLRYLRSPNRGSGVSSIQVPADPAQNPKECTDWVTIDAPTEVVEKLRDRNRLHFGQAQGTPFTIPPLSEDLDFTGATSSADMILDGTYDSSTLADITQLVISQMRESKYTIRAPLQTDISDDAYKNKIKSWKEGTSTSPSGLHLGHYHALIARHDFSGMKDTPEKDDLDSKQSAIRQAHLDMTNYALHHGYSFQRWRTVVNVMLQKEAGNSKIHRLRVIHLYEADYNLILSLKWREIMHAAEDEGLLNEGQYGSRPNRNAHDPVFIEELQAEICRASRKSNVKFDNDATSCYDRILPSFASIASRKFGIHKNVAFVMASTLQDCKYKLKTLLGVSEEFYKHCQIFPIYGTGQGSGNSPVIWCIISSILFDCHASRAHGATFESPDRTQTITFYMIGFVDDSTGQANDFLQDIQPSADILVQRMQEDAQLWNDLLWASGGALELPKCTYHVIDYAFTSDGAPIMRGGQVGGDIILQSGDRNSIQKIPFKSAHCSHKTLGHYKEPSGSQTKQYEVLLQKSNAAGIFVQCSALNRREAWTYYFAMYLPSVGYPLPNCHFTHKQLQKIQSKGMSAIFAKCGFNRKTKGLILYGPSRLGGASFRHLYTEQGIGQVQQFIRHWRCCSTQPGRLLRIAVSWVQYATGTGISFLTDVSTPLPHMESKWLSSLRTFLHTISGSIEVDDTIVYPLQRLHDCYLMDSVLTAPNFSPKQICQIHYCRLYLQVLTLSDITLASGISLDPSMYHGTKSLLSSDTRLHRFRQDRPSPAAWLQWRRACRLWSQPDGRLFQPLGAWLFPPDQLRCKWPAYKATDGCLYVSTPAGYDRHSKLRGKYSVQAFSTFQIPSTSVPVSILPTPNGWKIQHPISPLFHTPPPPPPGAFTDFLAALPPWESSLFHTITLTTFPTEIATLLSSLSFLSACDGSVQLNTHGSFGWCLSLPCGRRLAKCSGPVFGSRLSSYRAEAYGMLSLIRFFIRLFEYCDTPAYTHGTIVCDNLSLVDKVLTYQSPFPTSDLLDNEWTPFDSSTEMLANKSPSATLTPDWDVLNEIRHSLHALPFRPTIQHIKGHQDRKTPYAYLPLLAQLNIDADAEAGFFQDQHGCARPHVLLFPHAGAQLQITKGTITHNYKSSIRNAAHGPPLLEYIQQRNDWTPTTTQAIDWRAHELALCRRIHQRVHLTKLIHDILPTNENVCRWKENRQDKCPSCPHPNEDRDHVLRCHHPARQAWRQTFLISLRKTCDKLDTRPHLQDILLTAIDAWFNDEEADFSLIPPLYNTLLHQQTQIGWRQLFNGRLSTEWSRLQDEYLLDRGLHTKKKTGLLWTTQIITSIWDGWLLVWTIRNEVIHGHDQASRQRIHRLAAESEVRVIYENREHLLPEDQDRLFDDVDTHLSSSTVSIQNWLRTYSPMFTDSISRAKRRATLGVRSIRSYFARP